MARSTSIGDLAYYGAIGGGGWIAYNLALDGEFGCQAYQAIAQIYISVKHVAPRAPRPDTPAGKDPKCNGGLPGAPPASTPAPPAPTGPVQGPPEPTSPVQGPPAGPAPPSPVHHMSLEDFGGSSVHTDAGDICADHNNNCYTIGRDVFFDQNSDHSDLTHQWFWAARETLVNVSSGDAKAPSDFFTD